MPYSPSAQRYQAMPYHRCGRSGLKLPAVSLGLYQNFTDNDSFATCSAIVRRAFDLGITHFDLANNYGAPAGSAEAIFGRILRQDLAAHRDELIVTTKAGYDMWAGPYGEWGSRKYLLASLDRSLARLGLDYVDIFYSHRFDPETPLEETMSALASAVHQGKALYVGISNYDAPTTATAVRLLRELGTPCLVHQGSYSLLNRACERDLQPLLASEGVGSVIFQPLQRGILSDAYLGELSPLRQARLREWNVPPAWLAKLPALNELAHARGQTLAQMALAWTLRGGNVASSLVGASTSAQLEANVAALARLAFTPDELAQLDCIVA